MKAIKFNLKDLMADAEKDEAATKFIHKTISQDTIAELLKKTRPPGSRPETAAVKSGE